MGQNEANYMVFKSFAQGESCNPSGLEAGGQLITSVPVS